MDTHDPFGPHVCGHYIGLGTDRCMLPPAHSGDCPKRGAALRESVTVRLLGGIPPVGIVAEDGEWTTTVRRSALQDLVEDSGALVMHISPLGKSGNGI